MKMTEGQVRVSASDVANFLACQQLTQLDLLAARPDAAAAVHEEPRLRGPGAAPAGARGRCSRSSSGTRWDLGKVGDPAGATAAAIRGGAEVVYQGTLTGAGGGVTLFGRPDFLVRADLLAAPDGEPRPDGIHYEVVDAKLARSAKARAVLQASFYSRLLGDEQGIAPRWMHLALGDDRLRQGGRLCRLRAADAAAIGGRHRRGSGGRHLPGAGRALCHLPMAQAVRRAQANRR